MIWKLKLSLDKPSSAWDNRTQAEDYLRFVYPQTVYIDPPGVPTAAVHTQTMQVFYNTAEIQTVIVRTQSACMITDPEPEIEKAEVMMQTEAEEPTPVTDVDTQTMRVKLCESHMQTMKASLSHIHIQTDKPEISHSLVQTDEVTTAIDGFGQRVYIQFSWCDDSDGRLLLFCLYILP